MRGSELCANASARGAPRALASRWYCAQGEKKGVRGARPCLALVMVMTYPSGDLLEVAHGRAVPGVVGVGISLPAVGQVVGQHHHEALHARDSRGSVNRNPLGVTAITTSTTTNV